MSRFESFQVGAGSFLELASLHNIRLDKINSENEEFRDIIVRYFFSGEYQRMNAALCVSIFSVLRFPEQSASTDLRYLILDAVIGLSTKNTLQRALRKLCWITYASSDSIGIL